MNYGEPTLPINQINLRRVAGLISILVPRNARLRQLVARFAYFYCVITCEATSLYREVNATTAKGIVRTAEPRAIRTIIHNLGTHSVIIYESEKMVGVVAQNDRLTLTMPGRGRIWAKSKAGSQPLAITTIRMCECGITQTADTYDNPVGAFLL